jgi:hypothetical protein
MAPTRFDIEMGTPTGSSWSYCGVTRVNAETLDDYRDEIIRNLKAKGAASSSITDALEAAKILIAADPGLLIVFWADPDHNAVLCFFNTHNRQVNITCNGGSNGP